MGRETKIHTQPHTLHIKLTDSKLLVTILFLSIHVDDYYRIILQPPDNYHAAWT